MPVLASAQDRASTILKRAQQAKEDIVTLVKSDSSEKETAKEEGGGWV